MLLCLCSYWLTSLLWVTSFMMRVTLQSCHLLVSSSTEWCLCKSTRLTLLLIYNKKRKSLFSFCCVVIPVCLRKWPVRLASLKRRKIIVFACNKINNNPPKPSFSSSGLAPRIPRTVYRYFWAYAFFTFLFFSTFLVFGSCGRLRAFERMLK